MNRRKNMFRVGPVLCILLFLLIPLMSLPVAASGTWIYTTTATTTNNGGGPTATCWFPTPYTINGPPGPNSARFDCVYTFCDTYPAGSGGQGSKHKAILSVTPGGTTSTGWINIAANGGTVGGTLTINYGWYPSPSTWEVRVDVWCHDIASNITAYYYETHTIYSS